VAITHDHVAPCGARQSDNPSDPPRILHTWSDREPVREPGRRGGHAGGDEHVAAECQAACCARSPGSSSRSRRVNGGHAPSAPLPAARAPVDDMERADRRPAGHRSGGEANGCAARGGCSLHDTFRVMLDRLEADALRTSSAALQRRIRAARVARISHEVNQGAHGFSLRLEACARRSPPELISELTETKSPANKDDGGELLTLAALRPTASHAHTASWPPSPGGDRIGAGGRVSPRVFESSAFLFPRAPVTSTLRLPLAQEASRTRSSCEGPNVRGSSTRPERGGWTRGVKPEPWRRRPGVTFAMREPARAGGMRSGRCSSSGPSARSRPDLGTRVRLRVP